MPAYKVPRTRPRYYIDESAMNKGPSEYQAPATPIEVLKSQNQRLSSSGHATSRPAVTRTSPRPTATGPRATAPPAPTFGRGHQCTRNSLCILPPTFSTIPQIASFTSQSHFGFLSQRVSSRASHYHGSQYLGTLGFYGTILNNTRMSGCWYITSQHFTS
ncbi:hypothetical protein Micbo1qcDRAFT_24550 [Microdochium bolleyi]|uniref:Uncharacterized protein n=1 Tax=Microdochium bolleyi TaxID=196109 RepID=A0A136JDC4_9PEZI|nr:hypothetical protein Micbo1qcDRAFT_24550 [Microdochium bolleyi]